MTRRTPSESAEARARREARAEVNNLFARKDRLSVLKGPMIIPVIAGYSEETFLIRRLDLVARVRAGAWTRPITALVRRMMALGNPAVAADADHWDEYMAACAVLISEAAIIPPPEALAGDIEYGEITLDQCRPLFVLPGGPDPDADQYRLLTTSQYREIELKIDALKAALRREEEIDAGELAALEAELDEAWTFHLNDFASLAGTIINTTPGGLARFRGNGHRPRRDVGGVADAQGHEGADEPAPEEAAQA